MYHPTTRVLTVLELLQANERLTGAEIAARLEINQRTVRRYITMLQDLGLPVEAERGRYGAYRLRPGFKLPPLMFSEDEGLALVLGLIAARRIGVVVGAPSVAGALAKLQRVMPAELRSRVQAVEATVVLEEAPPDHSPPSATVVDLALATVARRRVVLGYRAFGGGETERPFDPYSLVYRAGRWYAVGYCHLRAALRVLRLDRVSAVTPCATEFAPPPALDSLALVERAIATTPGRWPVEVLLKTSLATARERVPAALATLEVVDDGVVLRCAVQQLDWFAHLLAGLEVEFEVCQPPELRAALERLAQRIIAGARAPAISDV